MKISMYTMLILSILLCAACAGLNQSSQQPSGINEPLRVMSFNIRFDNPGDGPNAWPHRKDFVASMLRFHKTDLTGIQEGLVSQVNELNEMLPEFDWVGAGRDDGRALGEFCAIYYRKTRFELIENGTFWLSESPDEPGSQSWDAALPRIATWARLYDKKNEKRFVVFNTHFDHVGTEARKQSAALILQKIDELSGEDPVILMGDLNVVEDQEPYKVLADPDLGPARVELFDGFYHSEYGHHGPATTWNGFNSIRPDRRIDYIFVNSRFSVIQHGSLADSRDGLFPSDHLPVVADLEFN